MPDPYTPQPEHHFTFGLWTVGNPGRDPFGHEVRPPLDPVEPCTASPSSAPTASTSTTTTSCRPASSAAEREAILKRFRAALDETGMQVPMATTNLFSPPGVQGGRVHRQRPDGPPASRCARRSTPSTSAPSSAPTVYVMWGGREGVEADAAKDVRAALDRYAEAVNLCCEHIRERGYDAADRARAEAERAARRHLPADRRPRAGVHRRARVARHGRPQPRVRPRDDVGPDRSPTPSRRRCGTGSSSTSTSTPSGSASTTRTSASAPRASATRSTS